MRTSNKILLGIFLVPLIILASVNLALYAKYKSGSYTTMKAMQEDRYTRYPLKDIRHIAVYGLNNFDIKFSVTPLLEIEKQEHGHLHFSMQGDSLVIHGDSIVIRPGKEAESLLSYQQVTLYLPGPVIVSADNSRINLQGTKDSLAAVAYQFKLSNSASLHIMDGDREDAVPVYFGPLSIQANESSIRFTARSHVQSLQLLLRGTDFTDNGASMDRLSLDADRSSNITLQGDNLRKINMNR